MKRDVVESIGERLVAKQGFVDASWVAPIALASVAQKPSRDGVPAHSDHLDVPYSDHVDAHGDHGDK